ncbi:MAG: polysaccharide deacetylase family protein, partial [Chloroflexota bacterium]
MPAPDTPLPRGGCGPLAVDPPPAAMSPELPQDKPTLVNVQIDLEQEGDENRVFAILDEIESRGWNATVYVTGEFARTHTETMRVIQQVRGHQLAVHGEQEGEDLSQLSREEQRTRLEAAFDAIRNLHGYPCADFRPQGLKQNIDTYEILQELEARSNTAFIAGPGPLSRPYHTSYGFSVIPIAALYEEGNPEGIPLIDEHIFGALGASPDEFFDILRRKFDQNNEDKEPMVMVINASIVGADGAKIAALGRFLDHVKNNGGQVVLTDIIASMANPYIGFLRLEVPPFAAPGDIVTITYTFSVLMYCPTYYFKFYGRYPGDMAWTEKGSASWYLTTGTWIKTTSITIPTLPTGVEKDFYTVRVTARGCHSSYNCWPTASSYEKQANATIKIIKGIRGKVEYAGDTVYPKAAMKSLKVEYLENNAVKHTTWTEWDVTYQIPADKLTNGLNGKLRFHLIHSILSNDTNREFMVHAEDQADPYYKERDLGVIDVTKGYEINETFAGNITECGSCYYTLQRVWRFWLMKGLAHTGVIKVECGDNDYADATSYMNGNFMSMWHQHITKHADRGANIIAHEYGHRVSDSWNMPYGPGGPGDGLPRDGLDENWSNYAACWALNHWTEYYDGGSLNFSTQTFTLTGSPGWSWSMADAWLDLNLQNPKEPLGKTKDVCQTDKPNTIRKFYEGYVKSKPITYANWVKGAFTNHGYNVAAWPVTTAIGLDFPFATQVITFSNDYADRGIDTNGDGHYESLVVSVGLTSASTGIHNVSAGLYDAVGNPIL